MRFKKPSQFPKDIPIDLDDSQRYIPWVIGLLVFLLCLLIAGASSISSSLNRWHSSLTHKLTVEIPVISGTPGSVEVRETGYPLVVMQTLQYLQKVPGIETIEVVEKEKLLKLLEPWLGQTDLVSDLRLPYFIDVEISPNAFIDITKVTKDLRQYVAGIRIEVHSRWQQILSTLSYSLQFFAYFMIILIAIAVMVIVSLITRSNLLAHKSIIDILRLIGASHAYIAHQFQNYAFRVSLKGGMVGSLFSLPVIYSIYWMSHRMGVPEFMCASPDANLIILMLVIPFFVAIICMMVARLAVVRTLLQMR